MTLLSEPLPLRKTTILGAFARAGFIAHRYGVATGELVQFDETGLLWLWADHASESIDDVAVEGVSVGDWTWRNDVDPSGHPITLVQFGQPQDSSTTITATGRGKRHPSTGILLENPADIVFDILANIAGRAVSEGQVSEFRSDCDRLQIIAGGSVETNDSAQTYARQICESVGGFFCGDGPQLCRIWPEGAPGVPRITITRRHTLTPKAVLADIVNDLTIEFAFAAGEATQSLQVEAPDSIANPAIGRRPQTLSAPWINDARVAADVGLRLLRLLARPQWVCTASGIRARLYTGDTVTLAHPRLPIAGDFVVQSSTYDTDTRQSEISLTVPAGEIPDVVIAVRSNTFATPDLPTVSVETVGDQRRLTLFGPPNRRRLANADVSLDGAAPRRTDAGGQVYFPASMVTRGWHTLYATADGMVPLTASILVT